MSFDPIPISPRTVHVLIIFQVILAGLASVAGAAGLTDAIGPKTAFLFVVVVNAANVSLSGYMAKVVAQTVSSVGEATGQAVGRSVRASAVAREAHDMADQAASDVRHLSGG